MTPSSRIWISLTALSAVLVAGCAAGPQRAPQPTNPNAGNNVSTTTGDADACAIALGNTVSPGHASIMPYQAGVAGDAVGAHETTANGLIIGNIALVALPSADHLPTTPPSGAGTGTSGAVPGAPATSATGEAATPNPIVTGPVPVGSPNARGVPGGTLDNRYDLTPPGAPANVVTREGDAVERIKTACDKLADIRVVNNDGDKVRLGRITQAMRDGQPITDFMSDLTRMVQGATSVGGGRNANRGPANLAPAPGTPGITTTPGTTPPGPATTPTPGAPAAPRTTTTPATPGVP